MNEFEWRRQLRDLQQPAEPRRDLWAGISAAMAEPAVTHSKPVHHTRRWLLTGSMAAALLLAGAVGWHAWQAPAATPLLAASPVKAWKPSDPRLAGAAIELDTARLELQLALQQAPDSPALQRLLNLTKQQEAQLRQLATRAG